jgi:hypothetical protein
MIALSIPLGIMAILLGMVFQGISALVLWDKFDNYTSNNRPSSSSLSLTPFLGGIVLLPILTFMGGPWNEKHLVGSKKNSWRKERWRYCSLIDFPPISIPFMSTKNAPSPPYPAIPAFHVEGWIPVLSYVSVGGRAINTNTGGTNVRICFFICPKQVSPAVHTSPVLCPIPAVPYYRGLPFMQYQIPCNSGMALTLPTR